MVRAHTQKKCCRKPRFKQRKITLTTMNGIYALHNYIYENVHAGNLHQPRLCGARERPRGREREPKNGVHDSASVHNRDMFCHGDAICCIYVLGIRNR